MANPAARNGIRILIVGKLNKFPVSKSINNQAFTLIELIVVITLISIVLAFALPKLNISFVTDNQRKLSTWIVLTVKSLKEKALREQTLYVLYLDFDKQQMWTEKVVTTIETSKKEETAKEQTSEEKKAPEENKYSLPEGYRLMDVEFVDDRKMKEGIVPIHFYPKGYSDKAIIHVQDANDNRNSYLIESFIPHVKIHEEYIDF
jgi:general secretion pathway protein H